MLKKLEALGARSIIISDDEKADLISRVEAEIDSLPVSYRNLLHYFCGDIEFDEMVAFHSDIPSPWSSSDGTDALDMIYGLKSKCGASVVDMFLTYKGRVPLGWFPIGAAPGGNQVCMCLDPSSYGSIGFWDHESEVAPDMPKSSDGITMIAPTLEDFIDRLKVDLPPKSTPGTVIVNLRF
jgi:hypothetical protein